jgi:hypothetical protein
MRRTRKVLAPLVSVLVTLGIAVTVHADVMQATGHLQGKKGTACVGPFFIDGLNGGGGFMVTGKTSPGAGEWTVVQSGDCRFETSQTIVDFTDTELSQYISVSENPDLFPGCFKLCVTKDNKNIDYSMLMDSGPF